MLFLYSVYEFWHSLIDSANFLSYTVVRTKGKDLQGQFQRAFKRGRSSKGWDPKAPMGFNSSVQKNRKMMNKNGGMIYVTA